MRDAVATPPEGEPAGPPPSAERPDVFIVEAGASRERRCAECGKRTATWKAVRRRGMTVILCSDCAAKSATHGVDGNACPSCDAPLGPVDRFCGKCGAPIEYACPGCAGTLDADDVFCGKCGLRLG